MQGALAAKRRRNSAQGERSGTLGHRNPRMVALEGRRIMAQPSREGSLRRGVHARLRLMNCDERYLWSQEKPRL